NDQKGNNKQVAQYDTDKRENSNRFRTYDVEGIGPGLSTMGGGGLEPCITVLGNTSKTGYRSHDVHGTNGISPTIQARDYKGPKQIAIREATKKGYKVAKEEDSVNLQYPGSETRRGKVGKSVTNTLEAIVINQVVLIKTIKRKTINV